MGIRNGNENIIFVLISIPVNIITKFHINTVQYICLKSLKWHPPFFDIQIQSLLLVSLIDPLPDVLKVRIKVLKVFRIKSYEILVPLGRTVPECVRL